MVNISGATSLVGWNKMNTVSRGTSGYDIFLIAGQSNCHYGLEESGDSFPEAPYDSADNDIKQWGREGANDGIIISAAEPLDHYDKNSVYMVTDAIGWALTFAKIYKAKGHLAANRDVLLIPAANGGTSFGANDWNKGDTHYEDAKDRTLAALAQGTGNVIKGILWQQGESDCYQSAWANNYETAFGDFIDDIRSDLGNANLPMTVGGMVPAWAVDGGGGAYPYYAPVVAAIPSVVAAKNYVAYADPEDPTELLGSTITDQLIHYRGTEMRGSSPDYTDISTCGLAGRHYTAWLNAVANT